MAQLFGDLFDDGPPIEVVADIRFPSTDEDGKSCSVRPTYRPNHNFGGPDTNRTFYIGQSRIPIGEEIPTGESRRLPIRFMSGAGLKDLLTPGRE